MIDVAKRFGVAQIVEITDHYLRGARLHLGEAESQLNELTNFLHRIDRDTSGTGDQEGRRFIASSEELPMPCHGPIPVFEDAWHRVTLVWQATTNDGSRGRMMVRVEERRETTERGEPNWAGCSFPVDGLTSALAKELYIARGEWRGQ